MSSIFLCLFQRVEDLALVSGVGATKLTQIRLEICVSRKKASENSSIDGSNELVSGEGGGGEFQHNWALPMNDDRPKYMCITMRWIILCK